MFDALHLIRVITHIKQTNSIIYLKHQNIFNFHQNFFPSDTHISCTRSDVCGYMHGVCCPCNRTCDEKCKEPHIIPDKNKEGECPTTVSSPKCLTWKFELDLSSWRWLSLKPNLSWINRLSQQVCKRKACEKKPPTCNKCQRQVIALDNCGCEESTCIQKGCVTDKACPSPGENKRCNWNWFLYWSMMQGTMARANQYVLYK